MTKPFSPREMIARINAVLRRLIPEATEEVVELDGLRLDPVNHRVTVENKKSNWAYRISSAAFHDDAYGTCLFAQSITDRVWGDHVFVEDRTVDVHIRRLRKALELVGKDALIQTVRGSGYRFSSIPALPAVDSDAEM
jgi:two-component system phosphate regulon response regulator PhoB